MHIYLEIKKVKNENRIGLAREIGKSQFLQLILQERERDPSKSPIYIYIMKQI